MTTDSLKNQCLLEPLFIMLENIIYKVTLNGRLTTATRREFICVATMRKLKRSLRRTTQLCNKKQNILKLGKIL